MSFLEHQRAHPEQPRAEALRHGLVLPEDGFVSASAKKMRTHLEDEHDYKMRSGKDKRASKQSKKAAH